MSSKTAILTNLVLALGVGYYVSVQLDTNDVIKTLATAHAPMLALGFMTYLTNYALRAFRFNLLLDQPRASYLRQLVTTQLHGAINYILPARIGELSYPWLAKQIVGTRATESATALVLARLFDIGVISGLVVAIIVLYGNRLPPWLVYSLLAFAITGIAMLGGGYFLGRAKATHLLPPPPSTRSKLLGRVRNGFAAVGTPKALFFHFVVTALIWLATLGNFYLVARALGFDVTIVHIVLLCALALPLSILPTHGFANIGAHEFAWTFTFQLLGDSHKAALSAAVGTHVVLFVMVLAIGGLGVALCFVTNCRAIRTRHNKSSDTDS